MHKNTASLSRVIQKSLIRSADVLTTQKKTLTFCCACVKGFASVLMQSKVINTPQAARWEIFILISILKWRAMILRLKLPIVYSSSQMRYFPCLSPRLSPSTLWLWYTIHAFYRPTLTNDVIETCVMVSPLFPTPCQPPAPTPPQTNILPASDGTRFTVILNQLFSQ